MKRKIICYFETEAQCEAAVTALLSANIDTDAVRILSESTKKSSAFESENAKTIGSSAAFALQSGYPEAAVTQTHNYAQLPIATLLIRGDLFTFKETEDVSIGSHAVEVCGNKETLELAKDILLNLF